MEKRPNVTVKILLKYNDKILILRDKDGTFTFPGGRMKWKESILGALQRELKEELDYSLEKEPRLFDVWNYISKDGKEHYVMIYYAQQSGRKPKLISLEGFEMLWLTKEDFIKMGIIRDKAFVDKMFEDKWYNCQESRGKTEKAKYIPPVVNLNTVKYWNKIYKEEIESRDILSDNYWRNYKNLFKKIIEIIPDGSRVLDVGCGPGIFCRTLKKEKPNTKVIGIDFSDFVIEENKKRDSELNICYTAHDIRKETIFKKKFDAIVMTEVIEHFKNPERIIDNFFKLLKRGGLLFISCPHNEDVVRWLEKYNRAGEHLKILDHDDIFHILSKYSEQVVFIELEPLRAGWINWHILAYIKK